MTDNRPMNCRNRQRDLGFPYPKSGCQHCKTGGLLGCPFEKKLQPSQASDGMTKRGKLIGIVGYAGAGKTTITAEAIAPLKRDEYFANLPTVLQRNFSRPIIEMLVGMGIPRDLLDDKSRWNEPLEILCGHSIRYAATTLGTEWGRDHIGIDVWTRIALNDANKCRADGYHVIIDNVRFPSEMQIMRQNGATFIALHRSNPGGLVHHSSEIYIDELQGKCERQMWNAGTFPEAVEKMRKIIVDIINTPD